MEKFSFDNISAIIKDKKKYRFVLLVLFLAWFSIIGILIGNESPARWYLIIFTFFIPILLLKDSMRIAGLILFIFVVKGVFNVILGVLPRQVIWASDAFILILFFKSLHIWVLKKKYSKTQLFLPTTLFFTLAVFSGFFNSIPWFTMGIAFKDFFRYIILFFALINLDIDETELKSLISFFIIIIFIQIPVTIFQYRLYGLHDWVSGTLGRHGTGEMLVLVSCTISMLIGFYIYFKSYFMYLIAIPFLLIPPILGYVRAALLYIPVTVVFILTKNLHLKVIPNTLRAVLLLVILVSLIISIPFFREPINTMISGSIFGLQKQVNAVVLQGGIPGRLRAPKVALEWVNRERLAPFIGYGFGSTKESYFEKYTGKFFKTFSPRTNQLSSILIEMGFPGLIFYLWIIIMAFVMNHKFFINVEDNYWKAISIGLDGIIFMHLIGILYHNIWRTSYSCFPFWFFTAVIYSIGKQKGIFREGF